MENLRFCEIPSEFHWRTFGLPSAFFSLLVSRLRAAAGALFPPKGEEKEKSGGDGVRHWKQTLHREDDLADVLALLHEAVRVGALL